MNCNNGKDNKYLYCNESFEDLLNNAILKYSAPQRNITTSKHVDVKLFLNSLLT